jgi:hypothetical protein
MVAMFAMLTVLTMFIMVMMFAVSVLPMTIFISTPIVLPVTTIAAAFMMFPAFAMPLVVVWMVRVCPVSAVPALTNRHLVITATIYGITAPVPVVVQPWTWLVNYHFMVPIQIHIPKPLGQISTFHPASIIKIYILLAVYIIIHIQIRYIIILNIIVSCWPP